VIARTPEPPYYAVIFTSTRTESDHGYVAMSDRMIQLAEKQPGFLGGPVEEESVEVSDPVRPIKLSNEALAANEGSYWHDKEYIARKIYLKNDTLRYYRSASSESPIVPVGKDEFQMLEVSVVVSVKFEIKARPKYDCKCGRWSARDLLWF
jgi:hypothetical protein